MPGGDAPMRDYKFSYKYPQRTLTSMSVYNVGMQRCRGGDCWGPGVRDHYLIHYVIAGRGRYETGGECYHLAGGDMFLCRPGEPILYVADDDEPWEYCWVGFQGADARTLLSGTDFALGCPVLRAQHADLLALLMDIYGARGARLYEQTRMTGCLYAFLARLVQSASRAGRQEPVSAQYMRDAALYIANDYAAGIGARDVASHMGLSRSQLYRVFMEQCGLSPAQYLTHFRVKQAAALLETSDLPVSAVATSVGFDDALYFSRVFSRVMGCAPSQYAARNK